ncbi:MAG: arginine--tRNA ligase [Planctomycetes bacterium]|nr:arginine--tRNA ligase [Planctomycetota bacterium]
MDVFVDRIAAAISGKTGVAASEVAPLIQTSNNPERGDLALACFALAGKAGTPGKDAAMALAQTLVGLSIEEVEVSAAGPFVNFKLAPAAIANDVLSRVWNQSPYGASDEGAGQTVVIDFSSPNIAKPFHLGHLRSTVIGWSLRQIYRALGYEVVGVNHLGDWGTQFGFMITAWKRWGDEAMPRIEAGERDVDVFVDLYVKINELAKKDPGVREEARSWFAKLEAGDEEALKLWSFFVERSKVEFQRIYDILGIEHESERGEAFYNDKMPATVEKLKASGLLVEGMTQRETALSKLERAEQKLEKSELELKQTEGKLADESLKDKARKKLSKRQGKLQGELPKLVKTVERAREAVPADEDGLRPQGVDLGEGMGFAILIKVNGGTTYTTRDVTAAYYRAETYSPSKVLYVVGQDQRDHFLPWFKILEAMGETWAKGFSHIGFGKYKGMSTRQGTAVFLDEVLEKARARAAEAAAAATKKVELSEEEREQVAQAIGTGAIKFFDLKADRQKDIDIVVGPEDARVIDWDRLLNLKGDSGPYLQFAHARLAGILAKAPEGSAPSLDAIDFELLGESETLALIKVMGEFLPKIRQAAEQNEPSVISRYVLDLAAKTHQFLAHQRVLTPIPQEGVDTEALARARLFLVACSKKTIAEALDLLGIEALEKM